MFPIPQCVFLTRGVGAHRPSGEWTCAIAAAVFRFVKLDGSP